MPTLRPDAPLPGNCRNSAFRTRVGGGKLQPRNQATMLMA